MLRMIILSMFLMSFTAHADWNCTLSTELVGNPQHFQYYSHDAWDGVGFFQCLEGNDTTQSPKMKMVQITFNSAIVGGVAYADSKVSIIMNLITKIDPDLLVIWAPDVRGQILSAYVTWTFQRGPNLVQASLQSQSPDETSNSLHSGSLFIR